MSLLLFPLESAKTVTIPQCTEDTGQCEGYRYSYTLKICVNILTGQVPQIGNPYLNAKTNIHGQLEYEAYITQHLTQTTAQDKFRLCVTKADRGVDTSGKIVFVVGCPPVVPADTHKQLLAACGYVSHNVLRGLQDRSPLASIDLTNRSQGDDERVGDLAEFSPRTHSFSPKEVLLHQNPTHKAKEFI